MMKFAELKKMVTDGTAIIRYSKNVGGSCHKVFFDVGAEKRSEYFNLTPKQDDFVQLNEQYDTSMEDLVPA